MYSTADTAEAVGCPIRKSTDQSLLAAPRGLSQRAASFIASQCQGIHQMPFRRLISTYGCVTRRRKPARIRQRCIIMTQPTVSPSLGRRPCRVILGHEFSSHVKDPIPASADTCVLSRGYPGCRSACCRWRPRALLPGGGGRDRTDDLMLAKHALSQLSYAPHGEGSGGTVVGQGRLELPTSRLSSARSNQLSY